MRCVVDEGLGQKETGIVDQDFYAAEGFDCGVEHLAGGGGVRHVTGNTDEIVRVTQAGGSLLQTLAGAGSTDDVVAVVDECLGQAQANAAGCAGDDYGLLAHDGFLAKVVRVPAVAASQGRSLLVRPTIFVSQRPINWLCLTSVDT
ncbi:hypothetical protein D3C85_932240 [compost metagenome]